MKTTPKQLYRKFLSWFKPSSKPEPMRFTMQAPAPAPAKERKNYSGSSHRAFRLRKAIRLHEKQARRINRGT